jgi:hypothetical protein
VLGKYGLILGITTAVEVTNFLTKSTVLEKPNVPELTKKFLEFCGN